MKWQTCYQQPTVSINRIKSFLNPNIKHLILKVWLPRQNPVPGCPPGLEYLLQLDALKIHQIPSLLEGKNFIFCMNSC
jgi:hypothetical protein